MFPMGITTVAATGASYCPMAKGQKPVPVRWYLAEWRKHREMTQEALGFQMGATKSQISKLESGATKWDAVWLARAASALGRQPMDLLFPPEQIAAQTALNSLTKDERDKVIDLVKAISKKAS